MNYLISILFLSFLPLTFAQAKTIHVAVLAYDEMNILDLAGPVEVFNDTGRRRPGT